MVRDTGQPCEVTEPRSIVSIVMDLVSRSNGLPPRRGWVGRGHSLNIGLSFLKLI